eukprot:SM000005S17103  [mRNA]  locus=s5:166969:171210:- [translate_table: standard]
MDAQAQAAAVAASKVLVVGAGGIGCELLKTLVLSGFRNIELIDLDTIDVSNLNRQFLFRKRHVGQSKAKVAKEAVLKYCPTAKITAHHGNVKSPEFSLDFFQKFDVVMNGLDNLEARRHVNRLCLAASVPLIESGTTGYLGQVTVHVKGRSECYECQPKPAPKTYPTCTITNTPSKARIHYHSQCFGLARLGFRAKPVHCIVWAKELPFLKLFGRKDQVSDLDVRTEGMDAEAEREERQFFEKKKDESIGAFGRRVFDRIFGTNISRTLEMEDLWKQRTRPRPLFIDNVLPSEEEADEHELQDRRVRSTSAQVGTSTGPKDVALQGGGEVSAMASLSLTDQQRVWSIEENARVFLESIGLFFLEREEEIGSLSFDKDDQLAVEFVTAAANLRANSFGIPMQSLFDSKGIAGNIIHAVATTNAIVAGLIVIEAIKLLNKQYDHCRMTFCAEHPQGRRQLLLVPLEPQEANPKCFVCSDTPLFLEMNCNVTTLAKVLAIVIRGKMGVNSPMVMHGDSVLYETGDDLEKDEVERYEANAQKLLVDLPTPVLHNSVLLVEDFTQDFKCTIYIRQRSEFDEEREHDGIVLSGSVPTSGQAEGGEALEPEDQTDLVAEKAGRDRPASRKRGQEVEPEAPAASGDIDGESNSTSRERKREKR